MKADESHMNKLEVMSEVELLQAHAAIIDELLRRDVVRTRNNPVGADSRFVGIREQVLV